MNGAQAVGPSGTELDAVCSIGFGSSLFTGSGDESNVFGCGVLISSGATGARPQLLTVAHVLPYTSSGYHTLPQDQSTTARVTRWRIKSDGNPTGASGLCVDYQQVHITGYRVPGNGADYALCDLASVPAHITPYTVYQSAPASSDPIVLAGWGLDGATAYAGNRPHDCKKITGRTLTNALTTGLEWDGTNPGPNLYDSGGLLTIDGKLAALIQTLFTAGPLYRFRNDATFQIPGLYTPATPEPPISSSWILPTLDSNIMDSSPTTPASTGTTMSVASVTGKGAVINKAILTFNVAGIVSHNNTSLVLHADVSNAGASSGTLRFRRLRRVVTSSVTWNTYDGSNNWGTAGANNTSSDVYTADQFTFPVTATNQYTQHTVTTGLAQMIANAQLEDGVLRLLIEIETADTVVATIKASEVAGVGERPRLVIETTADTSHRAARGTYRGRLVMGVR